MYIVMNPDLQIFTANGVKIPHVQIVTPGLYIIGYGRGKFILKLPLWMQKNKWKSTEKVGIGTSYHNMLAMVQKKK